MTTEYFWARDEDGEYNERSTTVNGHKVTIHSDRDGEVWTATIEGLEPYDLDATNLGAAQREAIKEALALTR